MCSSNISTCSQSVDVLAGASLEADLFRQDQTQYNCHVYYHAKLTVLS